MLIRAMIGGGLTVGAIALARGPLDLVGLRFLQGAVSGTVAATTTLVAGGTPREKVGTAMGILSSAIAMGSAVGPFVGGVAAAYFGLRNVFLVGGALLLVAVVPVIFLVREAPIVRSSGTAVGTLAAIRAAGPGALTAITVLLVAQALLQISWSGSQPLVALRLLELQSSNATAATGIAFAASGVASAIAGVSYSRLLATSGYRTISAVAAVLAAAALVLLGAAPTVVLVIIATFLIGLFIGAIGPATSTMLGLEAPGQVQGRIFGLSASATAVGFGLGPLLGGILAGVVSVPAALYAMAAIALVLGVLFAAGAREPHR